MTKLLSALRLWAPVFTLLLALLATACAGDDGGAPTSPAASPAAAQINPVIVSSDLAVGQNRFVLGLLTQDNQEIIGAQVKLSFFKLGAGEPQLAAQVEARSIRITKTYTETHEGGVIHTHEAGETGVYVADLAFDTPSPWAIQGTATIDGQTLDIPGIQFEVLPQSSSPAIGAPAPASRQPILADVDGNIAQVDTSNPPNPEMHNLAIADAVTSGRPTLIVFATPAFCLSRICGPTKQVVDELFPKYKEQVNFIHVEPYDLDKARSGQTLEPIPIVQEWGLRSEPWVFLVDASGNIAAKFEAVVSAEELETALQSLLTSAGNSYFP